MSALARQFALRLFSVLLLFACASPLEAWPWESVRNELARLQKQTGLSLVTAQGGAILAVAFSHSSMVNLRRIPGTGTISPDGSAIAFAVRPERMPAPPPNLAISRADGSDRREYPSIQIPPNNRICWSYDRSNLVTGAMNGTASSARLILLNVHSGTTQDITSSGGVTSQCWSPDNKHLVYEVGGFVWVYDLEENRSRQLIIGREPTWSPNGNSIAFLDDDTYYVIRPSGADRHALFKKWHAESGLWWSPDSRFVAYLCQGRLLEGGLCISGDCAPIAVLRVRRLSDNSESRVGGSAVGESFQWVTNTDLFKTTGGKYAQGRDLAAPHPNEVFLVGHVTKQGWYPLKSGETILQVVDAAGDLLPSAKANSIYILRTENNKQRRIPSHFNKWLQGGEPAIPLQPGDVIVVP